MQPAVVHQWNFSTQYQFNNTTTLQVGYIGQRSTHLMVPMPYFQRRLNPDGTITPSPYLSGQPGTVQHSVRSPGPRSNGTQSYNALQAVLHKSDQRAVCNTRWRTPTRNA